MKLIVAEKRSVGTEIAKIVGAYTNCTDWYEGGGYFVSWAAGHLVEKTAMTEGIPWDASHLPILPDAFVLQPRRGRDGKPDERCVRQLETLRNLMQRSDEIINAGDAGREGEVIQRFIYEYIGNTKPVRRLWVSSLTDQALREALSDLRPSSDYDSLFAAGNARTIADWLVGINATRALTATAATHGRVFSLGRVQTPTLALVCRRFIENRDFKSVPFWTVIADCAKYKEPFATLAEGRFDNEDEAQRTRSAILRSGTATVTSYEEKEGYEGPPLLHDITSMEKEAISRYGFSAAQVDAILEELYMKKLMTYPRTGSRYIPDDVFATVPGLLYGIAAHHPDPDIRSMAGSLAGTRLNRLCVNADKVTDHHALLPTLTDPGKVSLDENQRKVYDLLIIRVLQSFSAPCKVLSAKAELDCGGVKLTAKGRTILSAGWRAVTGEDRRDDEDSPAQTLPKLAQGEALPVTGATVREGKTKPKPLYTEATLIGAMQTAGRDSEDEQVRDALKDIGIGTGATRSSIIETLKTRAYIREEKKKIVPTETVLAVYGMVKDMHLASPELTGRWEAALNLISEGRMDPADFDSRIRSYAAYVVREVLSCDSSAVQAGVEGDTIRCPRCGRRVKVWDTNAKCTGCGLFLWRTVAGRKLAESTVKHLLEKGYTGVVRGLKSSSGKLFEARLKLVLPKEGDTAPGTKDRATVEFVFNDRKNQTYRKKSGGGRGLKLRKY